MGTTRWAVLAATLAAALAVPAAPAWAQYNFCFGPTIQRSVPNPVLTDGNLAGDNGWLNAFAYRGGDGTPDANIRLLGNTFQEGSHRWLALGVEALNDTQFDNGDAVVILYKKRFPGEFQPPYAQIVVAPLQNDQAPASIVNPRPGSSKYYTSHDGSTWTLVGDAPAWVTWGATATAGGGACTAQQPGTACTWTVELGIDLNAAGSPGDIDQLFVDVVEIVNRNPVQSRQFSWPPGNILVDANDTTITPALSAWGGASVGSTTLCKGVYFGHPDIGHTGLPLKEGVTSTLSVKLHNSATDAKGVIAHFSHAPFGVCGLVESCFQPIGSTSTPISCPNGAAPPTCCSGAAACIPPDPSNAGTGMKVDWTPAAGDAGHQCIRVKLEATANDTTFVNQGDFHNMWVASASTVAVESRINLKKVPPPVGGGQQRVRLLGHGTTQYAFADGLLAKVPIGTLTSQIIQQYKATRYTGRYVTVAGVRSEVWEPIGSYGFQLQHAMPPEFQKAFVERHAKVLQEHTRGATGAEPGTLRDLKTIRAINALLARNNERPPLADWQFQLQRGKPVPNTGGAVHELEIPVDGELTLPTVASFEPGGGPPPVCTGCCCPQGAASKTTPSKVGTLGLVVLAGAVVYRRRRRSR